jgi:hypothetical protein
LRFVRPAAAFAAALVVVSSPLHFLFVRTHLFAAFSTFWTIVLLERLDWYARHPEA